MAVILDARVKQKVGTEAEWMADDTVLLEGEQAFVVNDAGEPINFKIGDGTKTFAELPYWIDYSQAAYIKYEASPEQDVAYTFVGEGTYESIVVPEGEMGVLGWNGSSWSLDDSITLPLPRIPDWVAGEYFEGQQVYKDGQIYEVDVPDTTEEPGEGEDWISKIDLTPKVRTPNVAWGVSDNTPEKNLAIFLDTSGKFYFKSHPDSEVSMTNIKEQQNTDKFDFAISDNSENKFTIFGIKDGKIWTSKGWVDPSNISPAPTPINTAEQLPAEFSDNGIYNQWVAPMATDLDGSTYFTSIGAQGEIYLHKKTGDGFIYRQQIGQGEGDDHNNACILIDERPGAEFPIMIFQSNHQTTSMQYCKLRSTDPNDWVNVQWSTMAGGNVSYAQAFRYGDEILVHCRTATYQVEGQNTRGIRWYYSDDNGETWSYKVVFERAGHTQPYLQLKEKADKSGINIALNSHPMVLDYTGIRFITLDWASGAMSGTVGGTAIVSNFRDIFSNPSWTPLDTFDTGLEVLAHQADTRKRLLDITDSVTGETRVLYAIWPMSGNSMGAYRASEYHVIDFDMGTGVIEFDISVGEIGMPLERPAGDNLYIAGGCFIKVREVALARYRNQSYIDGGSNTLANDGHTDLRISRVHSSTNVQTFENLISFGGKGGRPLKSVGGDKLIMCQMDSYLTYTNYNSNLRIYNINDLKTWE